MNRRMESNACERILFTFDTVKMKIVSGHLIFGMDIFSFQFDQQFQFVNQKSVKLSETKTMYE